MQEWGLALAGAWWEEEEESVPRGCGELLHTLG